MGFKELVSDIKNKVSEIKERELDKAKFKRYVEEQTLPIRRSSYLKERIRNAVDEGRSIAQKEHERKTQKENQNNSAGNNFGLINTDSIFGDNPPFVLGLEGDKANKSKENNKYGK